MNKKDTYLLTNINISVWQWKSEWHGGGEVDVVNLRFWRKEKRGHIFTHSGEWERHFVEVILEVKLERETRRTKELGVSFRETNMDKYREV